MTWLEQFRASGIDASRGLCYYFSAYWVLPVGGLLYLVPPRWYNSAKKNNRSEVPLKEADVNSVEIRRRQTIV